MGIALLLWALLIGSCVMVGIQMDNVLIGMWLASALANLAAINRFHP